MTTIYAVTLLHHDLYANLDLSMPTTLDGARELPIRHVIRAQAREKVCERYGTRASSTVAFLLPGGRQVYGWVSDPIWRRGTPNHVFRVLAYPLVENLIGLHKRAR